MIVRFAVSRRRKRLASLLAALFSAWIAAYAFAPRITFANGPFYVDEFSGDTAQLAVGSRVPLELFGRALFMLEARHTSGDRASTVFVLTSADGRIAWARTPIMNFGRIDLLPGSASWHPLGGWKVGIKPAHHEPGRMYLSPFGGLRYLFHNW
ncbi:MAG TPA: hypothetical protein VLW45_07995 [Pelomicrobium sp.]|nr:hypothetical protein [Pelomicrobium sp.]